MGGANLTEIARLFGVGSSSTIKRWCDQARVRVLEPQKRMALGGIRGTEILWPGHQKRRAKARELRAQGKTFGEIAAACGYKGENGAYYAIKM